MANLQDGLYAYRAYDYTSYHDAKERGGAFYDIPLPVFAEDRHIPFIIDSVDACEAALKALGQEGDLAYIYVAGDVVWTLEQIYIHWENAEYL